MLKLLALGFSFLALNGAYAMGKAVPDASASKVIGEATRARYGKLKDATAKLVDDRGNGFEALYGVRNFRAVLNGVYYRGGANNYYHRTNKRGNENPLPNDGLMNLCEEGFTDAVYLYPTNAGTAPKITRCRTADGAENVLNYQQITGLDAKNNRKLLTIVQNHLRNERLGGVYMHCWNGWHASGYAAAITLRQFCGFTGDQAAQYWTKNIDKVEVGEHVRTAIRA
ncbi:MAG: hypothetical protein EOP11_17940, partial [Proteobacteria bacterium]